MNHPHVVISASAGSGKTFRLVHHFLGIVHDALFASGPTPQPAVIERTLATTFTRAAAGEITDRILKRIAKAYIDDRERQELCEALELKALSQDECAEMLQAVVARLHRLRVCTLDSFMVRSAQAFATELGLPDRWTILDDAADEAAAVEAVDELLETKAMQDDQFRQMADLITALHSNCYPVQIRQKVVKRMRNTRTALEAGPAEAWEVIAPADGDMMEDEAIDTCVETLAAMLEPLLPRTKDGRPNGHWTKALTTLVQTAVAGRWDDVVSKGLVSAMAKDPPIFQRTAMSDGIIRCLTPLRRHATAKILFGLRDRNRSTRDLLREYVEIYARVKGKQAAYRFEDFTTMLLDAGVSEKMADFYYRLDAKIDHVLLDEFQDTSISQWKLIRPLVDEVISGEGASDVSRSFFCVGDVKQTLYGWRNAEPQLLGELGKAWSQITQKNLVVSRRSAPVIIKTTNRIFEDASANASLTPSDDDHAYLADATTIWSKWFETHHAADEKKEAKGFARLLSCADGESTADRQQAARRLAVRRAGELHEIHPTAEIAILVRRRQFIGPLLAMLRRDGLWASGEGGSSLADDMAVCVVLSLLHLIDHPSDSAAAFHAGSSPLGQALGFTETMSAVDVLQSVRRLRAEIVDVGLGATINQWMGLCAATCDARNFRRLGQLVESAHEYPYDGGTLGAFIDTVKATRVEDLETARIRVMTIHASKGREFDYVILPDLDGDFIGGGSTGPSVLMERDDLLGDAQVITVRPSKAACAVEPRLRMMSQASKARQVVEELCALYVAVTRAKTGLDMIVHPKTANQAGEVPMPASAAGVLRAALYGKHAVPAEHELWRHEESVMTAGKVAGVGSSTGSACQPIHLSIGPPVGSSRVRPEVSPSAMEGSGCITLDCMLDLREARGRAWGTVMHRWLEMIEWLDRPLPTDLQFRNACKELEITMTSVQLGAMIGHFRDACRRPNLANLLQKDTYLQDAPKGAMVEVWRERPFAVPMDVPGLPTGAIVRGQIDRVVVVRRGAEVLRAEVIDYKSDSVDPQNIGEKRSHYRPQVAAYRKAVGQMLGMAQDEVAAKLAFIGVDAVVDI